MNRFKFSVKNKIFLRAFGLLGILVILILVVIRIALTQIPAQNNKLAAQIRKEQVLRQKLEVLNSVEAQAASQAELISFALPHQNSSFAAVSQIKLLAASDLIIITNLKIGAETKDGSLMSADISFDAEGALPSVLNFLQGIDKVAPIMVMDKIQVNQAQGAARATVRLKVFWAELPKALPAITDPVNDLSNNEKEILSKVLTLSPPEFVFLEPEAPRENTNPF